MYMYLLGMRRFYKFVAMNMTHSYKAIYAAAAEVTAMCLQFLDETEKGVGYYTSLLYPSKML